MVIGSGEKKKLNEQELNSRCGFSFCWEGLMMKAAVRNAGVCVEEYGRIQ